MNDPKRAHRLLSALLLGLILTLLAVGVALAAGNIDATNKWAWGANVGWVNFAPDNGGVTVYGDHLEGYAWAENVGWIKLGVCTGGSSCTHLNTTNTTTASTTTAQATSPATPGAQVRAGSTSTLPGMSG